MSMFTPPGLWLRRRPGLAPRPSVRRENRMTNKKPPAVPRRERKGGKPMYTEYGYEKDGVEYAPVDETEEA